MGLPLPQGAKIESIELWYSNSNLGTYISQIRLTEMGSPDQAIVLHDDGTDLTSTTATTYTSQVGGITADPKKALNLHLLLKFANVGTDEIKLGAVGIKFSVPETVCVPTTTKALLDSNQPPPDVPGCLRYVTDAVRGFWGSTGSMVYNQADAKRWFSLSAEVVNVQEFGAGVAGSANDAEAIQAAIDACSASGGGVVYIPTGTYVLTSTLLLPSNIELRGAGPGSTILKVASNHPIDAICNADPTTGNVCVTIRDIEIDGSKANNPRAQGGMTQYGIAGSPIQAGIHWRNTTASLIVNCYIHDCPWSGIAMSGCTECKIIDSRSEGNGNIVIGPKNPDGSHNGFYQFEAMGILLWDKVGGNKRIQIVGCTVRDNEKYGIEILGVSHEDNLVLRCLAENNNSAGICFNGALMHPGSVVNCVCVGNTEGGISVYDCHHVSVVGNFLSGNAHGIFKGYTEDPPMQTGCGINLVGVQKSIVSGNIVVDTQPQTVYTDPKGISCHGLDNQILGNRIENVARQGIIFDGSGNLVRGNAVINAGTAGAPGIQADNATSCTIDGNHVTMCSQAGVYCAGAGGNHRISGNFVQLCGAGIMLVAQDDCVVEGNICMSNGAPPTVSAGIGIHTCLRTVVVGNRCGNNAADQVQTYGIQMMSAPENAALLGEAVITGNVLVGNTTDAAVLAGSGNQVGVNLPCLPLPCLPLPPLP